MHPLLPSIACGHGSLVTPKSTLVPSLPVCGVVDSWDRQPGTASTTASMIASAATMLRRMIIRQFTFRSRSVRERPCLPVVADANPYPEQTFRLEQEEPDDQ